MMVRSPALSRCTILMLVSLQWSFPIKTKGALVFWEIPSLRSYLIKPGILAKGTVIRVGLKQGIDIHPLINFQREKNVLNLCVHLYQVEEQHPQNNNNDDKEENKATLCKLWPLDNSLLCCDSRRKGHKTLSLIWEITSWLKIWVLSLSHFHQNLFWKSGGGIRIKKLLGGRNKQKNLDFFPLWYMQAGKLKNARAGEAFIDVVQHPLVLDEEPAKRLKSLLIIA